MLKNAFRYWTVRIQLVCQALAAWLTIDPTGLLAVWNMMPGPVRTFLPANVVQVVGAVLFVLSWVTMLARVVPEQVKRPRA